MTLTLRTASEADREAWDAFVRAHPQGLAYHRWAWGQAVERAYGFRWIGLLAEEGGEIQGVLPLVELRAPLLGPKWVSLPYCDAGGILAAHEGAARALREQVEERASRGKVPVELRFPAEPPEGFPRVGASGKVRMVLDLPESSEALLASFKSKLRSQVRKPERDGLTAGLGGAELLEPFWRIYARNMRDLGSPPHPLRWFRAVMEAFGDDARIGMAFMPDGTPAAGGLVLRNGPTVSIPWASSVRELNRWNPNMLAYWTLLAHAADTGATRFDFGRSTPGEGTYRFKAQWGAREEPLTWLRRVGETWTSALDGAGTGGRFRAVAEHCWQRLPVGVSSALGGSLRKYVDL
ncbi:MULTISPECIES: GNAT family protein [Deferrisoma]